MPQFNIRYFDPATASVAQECAVADSEESLRAQWARSGKVVLALTVLSSGSAFRSKGSSFKVAWWCRELGTLLTAGMTVVESIETLLAQSQGVERDRVHRHLLESLRKGQALSKAMLSSGAFPSVLIASVKASERTSTLSNALDDYLLYDEMLKRLRRQAVSSAIYPAIVVSLGFAICLFLLLYVIPRFSKMYVDVRGELSVATHALIWTSRWLQHGLPYLVGAFACLVVAGVWAWRSGLLLLVVAQLADDLTPLRKPWDHFRHAKLYQSLALMFRGGYTLDEALQVCEEIRLGPRLSASIQGARSAIARGQAVSSSFTEAGLADVVAERLLRVGERSGGFDSVLQTIADRHATSFATFVERATRVVEPVLLLFVALAVGGIVVMMYMPIFDIANGLR